MTGNTTQRQPTTPFPNALLDHVMPSMRDTEWRILCVIVRQTLGWKGSGPGQRKRYDWLSQSQLMKRTGRSSEAISKAIDRLVRRGLIEVCGKSGDLLETPQERRHHGGQMYFAVAQSALGRLEERPETPYTNGSVRGEVIVSLPRKIEVRKPNTTKEKQTKYVTKKGLNSLSDTRDKHLPTYGDGLHTHGSPIPGAADIPRKDTSVRDVESFKQTYLALMAEIVSSEPLNPANLQGWDTTIRRLLGCYGTERLTHLARRFLNHVSDTATTSQTRRSHSQPQGCSLHDFDNRIKSLLVEETKERLLRPPGAAPLSSHCLTN